MLDVESDNECYHRLAFATQSKRLFSPWPCSSADTRMHRSMAMVIDYGGVWMMILRYLSVFLRAVLNAAVSIFDNG